MSATKNQPPVAERVMKGREPVRTAPPGAVAVELQIGPGLVTYFATSPESSRGTQALLPHYAPFGPPDVEQRARLKIFVWCN